MSQRKQEKKQRISLKSHYKMAKSIKSRKINKNHAIYFDSFGNLQPPSDLVKYLNVGSIEYNYQRYQDWDTWNCGHLCLKFLTDSI